MRLTTLALGVAVAVSSACGSQNPVAPNPEPRTQNPAVIVQTPTTPDALAFVVATGPLTITGCSNGLCAFSGTLTNRGTILCASRIRGVIDLQNASGVLQAVPFRLDPSAVLGLGASTPFAGDGLSEAAVQAATSFRAELWFDSIACA